MTDRDEDQDAKDMFFKMGQMLGDSMLKSLKSDPSVKSDLIKHITQAQTICREYFDEGRGDDEYVTKLAHEYLGISIAEITRLNERVRELHVQLGQLYVAMDDLLLSPKGVVPERAAPFYAGPIGGFRAALSEVNS